MNHQLSLQILPGEFVVCRLEATAEVPPWALRSGQFCSVSRTADELSIIAEQQAVPGAIRAERGWSLFRVAGTLPSSTVGVLSAISGALAAAGISVLCVATHDTDYFLVPGARLKDTREVLVRAGHRMC